MLIDVDDMGVVSNKYPMPLFSLVRLLLVAVILCFINNTLRVN